LYGLSAAVAVGISVVISYGSALTHMHDLTEWLVR